MKNIFGFGLVFLSLLGVMIAFYIMRNTPPESVATMIAENEADYTKVANLYYNDYQNFNIDTIVYSTEVKGEVIRYADGLDDFPNIELKPDEIVSFRNAEESYLLDKKGWDRTCVSDNFVSFSNINGRESLVYSVDGSKPKFVNSPDDKRKKVLAVKITEHWYYVNGK